MYIFSICSIFENIHVFLWFITMYVVFSWVIFEAVTRVNNTLCFNCQDASSPEKCDTVDICNYDEVWNYFNLKCFRTSNFSVILLKNHHFINLSECRLFYIKDDNLNISKSYTFINKIYLYVDCFLTCCLLQNVSFFKSFTNYLLLGNF